MRSMWKFPLSQEYWKRPNHHEILMPVGAVVRLVGDQDHVTTLWAEVPDTDAPRETRRFSIVCTGDPIPDGAAHVGSLHPAGRVRDEFVYHVFEVI